jgi:hypothetical protein
MELKRDEVDSMIADGCCGCNVVKVIGCTGMFQTLHRVIFSLTLICSSVLLTRNQLVMRGVSVTISCHARFLSRFLTSGSLFIL